MITIDPEMYGSASARSKQTAFFCHGVGRLGKIPLGKPNQSGVTSSGLSCFLFYGATASWALEGHIFGLSFVFILQHSTVRREESGLAYFEHVCIEARKMGRQVEFCLNGMVFIVLYAVAKRFD